MEFLLHTIIFFYLSRNIVQYKMSLVIKEVVQFKSVASLDSVHSKSSKII